MTCTRKDRLTKELDAIRNRNNEFEKKLEAACTERCWLKSLPLLSTMSNFLGFIANTSCPSRAPQAPWSNLPTPTPLNYASVVLAFLVFPGSCPSFPHLAPPNCHPIVSSNALALYLRQANLPVHTLCASLHQRRARVWISDVYI